MGGKIVVVGSLNLDLVADVARNPEPGETIAGSGFRQSAGGKGANQAVAAALMGARVAMVGRHGTDGFERVLLETLRGKGVDTAGVTPAEGPSGVAVILVTPDGGNSIVVVPGSNGRLCGADIEAGRRVLEEAGMILTQLETPLQSLEATVAVASGAGVPVMLDPAPARPLAASLLRQIAWLTPNETEAATLLGGALPLEEQGRECAERLLELGPKNVLLKLGARGAFVAMHDGAREFIPAVAVEAVDSTAAGDALNGAFAAALMEGLEPVAAARLGVAAAALSVTRMGAIASLATRAEVEAFQLESGGSGRVPNFARSR